MAVSETQPTPANAAPTSEALQRRVAELTEAVAARDKFIAVAAHELRNPMTPILGQIERLLTTVRAGQDSPEQIEQRLERLQHAIYHYLKRATILLNVSRVTSGRLQLEPEPLDLAQLLREMAGDFAPEARHAGASVTASIPESLFGTWDRVALQQIVENLVSNAIKYGGRTPVELSAEPRGACIRIQIRDHGGGIAPEDRQRVFQPFERAVGRGEQASGFGVGLWVVGQLVQAMGGTVIVDDAQGGGALFTVTLPRHVKEPRP